jgi:hypothetical protein
MTISSNTFTLPISANAGDYTDFAHAFVSNLTSVSVSVSQHEIDGGDLGGLEIDLEDIDVNVSEYIDEYTINSAIEAVKREGAAGEDFTEEFTLEQIREAYCAEHGRTPYEYLADVAQEIAETARNAAQASMEIEHQHKNRQESERAKASAHADTLLVKQVVEDRNKAQELYGEQSAQMREAVKLLAEIVAMRPAPEDWGYAKQREIADRITEFLTKAVWYEAEAEADMEAGADADADADVSM